MGGILYFFTSFGLSFVSAIIVNHKFFTFKIQATEIDEVEDNKESITKFFQDTPFVIKNII